MFGGDEVSAIVAEIGTSYSKAGYAGEDSPKCVFETDVGVLYNAGDEQRVGDGKKAIGEDAEKEITISDSSSSSSNIKYYVGTSALTYRRDGVEIANPLEKGLISNWDLVEQLWDHGFKSRLRIDAKDHPVLLGEPSFNTRTIREKMTELMFEKYQCPAVFIAKNAVLSSFASGRPTALVLDSGGGVTTAVPVHDGYTLTKGIFKSYLAGDELTNQLQKSLEMKGTYRNIKPKYSFTRTEVKPGEFQVIIHDHPNTTASYRNYMIKRVIRDIKETSCRVAETAVFDNSVGSVSTYELQDGGSIDIGGDRLKIPEVMFNPTLCTTEEYQKENPIHNLVFQSVNNVDSDIRRELYQNVVVTGGNTLFPGFVERLQKEMNDKVPQMYKVKLIASNSSVERKFSAWIGGSILASLGSFQQMWMSKAEYEEHGVSLVERKCP